MKNKLDVGMKKAETSQDVEWYNMPQYVHKDLNYFYDIKVHFLCKEDYDAFAKLIGQPLTNKTKSIAYPRTKINQYVDKRYIDES